MEQIEVPVDPRQAMRTRVWREWCFARLAFRHFRVRLAILVIVLVTGGLLFRTFEPEKNHSLAEATYFTWSLIFGEPPEEFPKSVVLQSLFFIVPLLGLAVIIEGIVDLSMMLGDRRRNERGWCRIMAADYNDHIVLVGMGRLGFRTFHLLRRLGHRVVVIERRGECQFLEGVRLDGAPLFIGDARNESLLEEANITKARSIILATNDDLANLEVALDARRLAPGIRVVLRMFDQHMADKIRDGFNIHIAMSQASLSAPAFATAAIEPAIVNSMVVNNQLVVMQRWLVKENGPLCNRTVRDILVDLGFSVVERRPRNDQGRLFPPPETKIAAGDEILVQGPYDKLAKLRETAT